MGPIEGGRGVSLLGRRGSLRVSGREAAGAGLARPVDRLALRPKEAAEALGVSEKTLRKWMRDEGLPYLKPDGAVLIPRQELLEWMGSLNPGAKVQLLELYKETMGLRDDEAEAEAAANDEIKIDQPQH